MPFIDVDLPDDAPVRVTPADILARITLENPTAFSHESGTGLTHQSAVKLAEKFHLDPAWNPGHYLSAVRKAATQEVDKDGKPIGAPIVAVTKSGAELFRVRITLTEARLAELAAAAVAAAAATLLKAQEENGKAQVPAAPPARS